MATAMKLARPLSDPIIRTDTLGLIAQAYAEANHFDQAKETCELLSDTDNPNLDAGGGADRICAKWQISRSGTYDRPCKRRRLSRSVFNRQRNVRPHGSGVCDACLVERIAEAGKFELADNICKRIKLTDYRALSHLTIAAARIATNDPPGAR